MSQPLHKIGVVIMTYGSPSTPDDVSIFMKNVYGGKDPDPELIKEFQRRYKLIGGSPLLRITKEQSAALEEELNTHSSTEKYKVTAGMRFAPPFIADVVKDLEDVDEIIGIIMSPQYSPFIMSGYIKALEEAVLKMDKNIPFKISTDWHLQPNLLQAYAQRVQEALDTLEPDVAQKIPILFSAHSMPKRVIEKEPDYINDLKETASEISKLLGLPNDRWMFCYQSAGHTSEEWLKPDFADLMPELAKRGHKQVLIAPVQFLADHLEILYDIEVGAREQAEEHDIEFHRAESLNTSALFIKALAAVVQDTKNS